jgi:drug/metabolite transporter (DMT)-like permease
VEWALIVVSGLLHVLYFITLLRGYRKADLTVVYPLARGSGPLISSLFAIVFLGEQLSIWGGLGIVSVVGGVFLIAGGMNLIRSFQRTQGQSEEQEKVRIQIRKGIIYGVLTGVFIAAYTLVDAYAVKVLLLSPILVDYYGNFTRLAVLAPVLLRDRAATMSAWKSQWKYALIVACVSPISYVLVLYAIQIAPISHVAPAREVSMLFAALIGGHLLKEGDRLQRILGALCIAVGVISLGLA